MIGEYWDLEDEGEWDWFDEEPNCAECDDVAVDNCQQCGAPLCIFHSQTGASFCNGCPTEDYNPHRRFETTTPDGHTITIKGDPHMDAEALEALGKVFDALYRKTVSGILP